MEQVFEKKMVDFRGFFFLNIKRRGNDNYRNFSITGIRTTNSLCIEILAGVLADIVLVLADWV